MFGQCATHCPDGGSIGDLMRISWLSVSDRLGGSEIALESMIRAVRAARPDWVNQVILPGSGPLLERLEAAGASCAVVPMPSAVARVGESAAVRQRWSTGSALALGLRLGAGAVALPAYESLIGRALSQFRPDIIHTNGLKAHVLGARAGLHGTAVVWHLHEYVAPRPLTRWLMRRYVRACDAIVANSASVASDVSAMFEEKALVHVVRNAVDLDRFCPNGPASDLDDLSGLAAAGDSVVRVGLAATFARWKGHEVFLDAMQRIPASDPVRGYIIGGPLYDTSGSQYTRRELEAMIDARNLRSRVGLTGFVDSAPAMRALDVVVHASVAPEPFGLVIAEAMACGRAVITTATGGAAELVSPPHDAVSTPPRDARALATAIERLAADPRQREGLGAAARASAIARFAPERMGAELVSVFEAVAARRSLARSA
jgi:glycosyltransferase involved in cell wall biosynthesis